MKKKSILMMVTAVSVFALVAVTLPKKNSPKFIYAGSALMCDLQHPDGYIRTERLSDLPKDLLKTPIIRDVFTKDLAFYYEHHEDCMSLSGTLKRIAYEHDLVWSDKLMESVFNEPAQIAYWKDGKGALRHYVMIIDRNIVTKVMQQIAKAALKDTQLSLVAEVETSVGKLPMYSLQINPRRTYLFISHGDKLIVFSDPGLFLSKDNKIPKSAKTALEGWLTQESLSKEFALDKATSKHTMIIRSSALAFGYSPFIPAIQSLRFDYGTSWSTSMGVDRNKLDEKKISDSELWKAAPANPSTCAMLPLDWNKLGNLTAQAQETQKAAPKIDPLLFSGPALVCWYEESDIYSPLFITRTAADQQKLHTTLSSLANWAINDKNITQTKGKKSPNAILWSGEADLASLGSDSGYVIFSPDRDLVIKSFDTIAHRFPNVTDHASTTSSTIGLITPKPLSRMVEREIIASVEQDGNANLLSATKQLLPPRMKALSAYPSYTLELSKSPQPKQPWIPLEWKTGTVTP
ncbi:DUF2138 family protein [Sulfuricurvum sp.]|uniref:DUF2138 family protein n=1 Tax=Sulfuricurvum sp. TaxID=2025608 RepID=UPI002E365F39|nr:DUF2138 family protein [Sulfuricurvum sp.]HEX5330119.1 DUF2138 family protein [Sulfuricurvum sp.]